MTMRRLRVPGESLRGYGELAMKHHCLDTMSHGLHKPIEQRWCHGEGDTQMWYVCRSTHESLSVMLASGSFHMMGG